MPHRPVDIALNRKLRVRSTAAEDVLWDVLRGRRVGGYKFRRQVHVGGWVVDFACLSHGLVVEVDGSVHDDPRQAEQDGLRDQWLTENGWQVLRFRNDDVLNNPDALARQIAEVLARAVPFARRDRPGRDVLGQNDYNS